MRQRHIATAPLRIMIIDKHKGILGRQQTPGLTPVGEPLERISSAQGIADLLAELELGDGAQPVVLVLGDGLAAVVDHLLEDEGTRAGCKTVLDVQVLQARVDDLEVARPHVFCRVDAKVGGVNKYE